MLRISPPYLLEKFDNLPDEFLLADFLDGWDVNLNNHYFQLLDQRAQSQGRIFTVWYPHITPHSAREQYKNLKIKFALKIHNNVCFQPLKQYNIHPELNFKNFVCSFNGSAHISRQFLTSILKKFNWFNPNYCSKNFCFTSDMIDGHLGNYLTSEQHRIYQKFFLNDDTFGQTVYSFGFVRFNHSKNIYNLEHKLTESFLHIVSETIGTSHYPFVTEKFLYSIVTRGLFLCYGQPGWHDHLEKYYGFKKYTRLFDYSFDSIQNPVERLVELMCMISKFSNLTAQDWHDLYLIEQETIEYNYNHYFSGDYLQCLEQA